MAVVYFGSLAVLLVSAFFTLDPRTSQVVHQLSLKNFETLLNEPVYRDHHHPDGRDGHRGDHHVRRHRVPHRVLHGARGVTPDASAAGHG